MTRVRIAAHVHSDWSYDGSWPLEALAAEFGRRGYDAVLMAEHDRGFDSDRWAAYRTACATASSPTLLVPGIEYSDSANVVHVPVWGDLPFLGEDLATVDLLRRVDSFGGVAVLAHPRRRGALAGLDPTCFQYLTGIELWNRKYDGFAPNRDAAELLGERPEMVAVVGLDFHTRRQFHPLAMVMQLDVVSPRRIIEAIRERRAHPTAFGLPALSLTQGIAWPAIRNVERARRTAAGRVRRARRFAQLHAR
jgi:hypothetical protein